MYQSTDHHPPRFYVPAWAAHRVGSERVLVHLNCTGSVLETNACAAEVLRTCSGARTLEEHTSHLALTTGQPYDCVQPVINALADAGLLVPMDAPEVTKGETVSLSVDAVGIPTADRPMIVRRGLTSAINHTSRYGRKPTFIVMDGSKTSAARSATRAAVQGLEANIIYVDREGLGQLRTRLLGSGIPDDLVDFGCASGSIGANRNALLLLTAGHAVVMADDDIVWQPWASSSRGSGVAIGGHAEQAEWVPCETRDEAFDKRLRIDEGILQHHEAVLGGLGSDLLKCGPDLTDACSHVLNDLAVSEPLRVRVTMTGVAGDAAIYCPHNLLFADDAIRSLLSQNARNCELAFSSREVRRVAQRLAITHDTACMAGCIGLDNLDPLPPFCPVGRNEDGVFGQLLGLCDRRALFAHLPCGVLHDSPRPSERAPGIPSATRTRFSEVLGAILSMPQARPLQTRGAIRLDRVSVHLREVGSLSFAEFRTLVIQLLIEKRSRQLSMLEAIEDDLGSQPHWRAAAAAYRKALLESISEPNFFCPPEPAVVEVGPTFSACQQAVHRFGRLAEAWPQMWAAARGFNATVEGVNRIQ